MQITDSELLRSIIAGTRGFGGVLNPLLRLTVPGTAETRQSLAHYGTDLRGRHSRHRWFRPGALTGMYDSVE